MKIYELTLAWTLLVFYSVLVILLFSSPFFNLGNQVEPFLWFLSPKYSLLRIPSLSVVAYLTLLSLLLLGLFLFLWTRYQKKKMLYHQNKKLMEEKLESQMLLSKQLKEKLGHQKEDITDLALDIARKNAFFKEVIDRLSGIEQSAPDHIKDEIHSLKILATSQLQIDEDRSLFHLNIQEVNREFYGKLEEVYGELSSNEKELCGLIRLNLSNKDIAAIKNISINSAKMSRYRLRKRLGLQPKDDIVKILQEV